MFEQFRFLIVDLKRWKSNSLQGCFYRFFEAGLWATVFYRLNRALFLIDVPVVKILIRFFCFFVFKFSEAFLGVSLPASVSIGPGMHIGHAGLIVFHHEVKIGKGFTVTHGVTIGAAGLGKEGVPVLGDDVFVGSGAKVLGNIQIGNRVRIGANAVVVSDVPDNSTAVGVPARIVIRAN